MQRLSLHHLRPFDVGGMPRESSGRFLSGALPAWGPDRSKTPLLQRARLGARASTVTCPWLLRRLQAAGNGRAHAPGYGCQDSSARVFSLNYLHFMPPGHSLTARLRFTGFWSLCSPAAALCTSFELLPVSACAEPGSIVRSLTLIYFRSRALRRHGGAGKTGEEFEGFLNAACDCREISS